MELLDRVVLITGASSGIGAVTARRVAAEGAKVVLAARRTDRIEALALELGGSAVALAVPTDMREPDQVRALIAQAADAFGGVDVLVNNAGQGLHAPMLEIELQDLVAITELNVYAPLVAMQAVVPIMQERGGGAIVNVSSGTTLLTPVGNGGYAATKAALNLLSLTTRAELADDNIVVSTVYPFITATEFFDTLQAGAGGGPTSRSGFEPDPPEKVADAIVALIRSGDPDAVLLPEPLRQRTP